MNMIANPLAKALTVLFASTALIACVPADIGNTFTQYNVSWPTADEKVIREDLKSSTDMVTVEMPDTQIVPIYFNGQNHDECFVFSAKKAVASLSCLAPFARQGENTIIVNPGSLLNSYTRFFVIDSEGPKVNLHNVCYASGADCELSQDGDVSFDVTYKDPSDLEEVYLTVGGVNYSPKMMEGLNATYQVPVSDHYIFTSTDVNGFISQHDFQKDGDRLNEIFNVRIDETMLDKILPLINKGITGMESGNPDGSDLLLEDIEVQALGLVNMLADVRYIKINNFEMTNLSINDSNADLETNLTMEPFGERDVDWINNNGTVEDADDVGIEVIMSVQDVLWCYDPLGWIPACQPCKHSAFDMCQPGLIKMDMHMYIEKMNVNAKVNNDMVTDGNFHIKLEKQASGKDVLIMKDTYAAMSGSGSVSGSQSEGILGSLISGPLLRGLILDIVEDTINRNLNEIVISSNFVTDNDVEAEMALSARIDNLSTDLGAGNDNVGNLNVKMSGIFDTIKSDPTIAPALGSYHVDDTVLPVPVDDGSSLSVVVNSNMVNQALLAAYNIGVTHLTVMNGNVYTGQHVTDELGSKGNFRVELIPSSPGQFQLHGDLENKGHAFLEFQGAAAIVSAKGSDGWNKITSVDVDIRAGVYLSVVDGYLGISIASTPELVINKMDKLTLGESGISINIDAEFVRKLVQGAVERFTPAVADSVLKIDVSKLGISEDLYTDGINTSSGHLEFKQGLNH